MIFCVECGEDKYIQFPFFCTLCWARNNRDNKITQLELINYLYLSTGILLYFDFNHKIDLIYIYNSYKILCPNLLSLSVILDKLLYLKLTFIKFNTNKFKR
jgi:hypothetical protein